jgi:2-keto-4-pentenoate hydratase
MTAAPSTIADFAARLLEARRTGALLDAGPEPTTRAEAFCAQRLVCEAAGATVAGWKIADHPTLGMIAAPIHSVACIDDGMARRLSPRLGVEIEIALRLNRDLPRGVHDRAAILAAIDGYCVGVEFVGARLAEPTRNLYAFLGDDMANAGYVMGGQLGPWRDEPVAGRPCRFTLGDVLLHEAPATPPALDPIAVTIAWLAVADDALGGLRAGQFVTTGSLCGVVPVARRGAAVALLEGFGEVRFDLV